MILLINPPETEQSGFTNPPIGLLYLAGTLEAHGIDVGVVDGCITGKQAIRDAIRDVRPSIVGITCLTPARSKAIEVARMAKDLDPAVTVVLGGAHPTIMYKQMLDHYPFIDYVVLGEGEATFLEIAQGKDPSQILGLAYRDKGVCVKTHNRHYVDNLDEIPFPAWHLIDLKKYPAWGAGTVNGVNLAVEPRISIIFSRGCKGHCDFCSTWWIWRGWRHRSARNMVDEIELLVKKHGVRHFWFADDALTIDREATLELCDEIIARKLRIAFFATTRSDCVDEAMLRRLKEAGCYEISYGVETGSPVLLEKMGKENDIASSEQAIALSKKVGLRVTALMIVGNMGETDKTIQDTIDFLRRTEPDEIGAVGGLWVLPGTKVYRECKSRNFISDEFWLTDEPFKIYTLEHSLPELRLYQQRVLNYSFRARIHRMRTVLQRRRIRFVQAARQLLMREKSADA